MREESLRFGADPVLAGRWSEPKAYKAVALFSHPHPAYGGSMFNNVVEAGCETLCELGLATFRYDFRGAGLSGGTHDHGRGERHDVIAAATEVRRLCDDDAKPLILIGYSYGAWITWSALSEIKPVSAVILISPPLGHQEFDFVSRPNLSIPVSVIIGSEDVFCPPSIFSREIEKLAPSPWHQTIAGVDHFWQGKEVQLSEALYERIRKIL